ncbi:MAG: hypothetical protein WDO73_36870 [Ignavibacteriota bacterium]
MEGRGVAGFVLAIEGDGEQAEDARIVGVEAQFGAELLLGKGELAAAEGGQGVAEGDVIGGQDDGQRAEKYPE